MDYLQYPFIANDSNLVLSICTNILLVLFLYRDDSTRVLLNLTRKFSELNTMDGNVYLREMYLT